MSNTDFDAPLPSDQMEAMEGFYFDKNGKKADEKFWGDLDDLPDPSREKKITHLMKVLGYSREEAEKVYP